MSLYFDIHSHQKSKIDTDCARFNNVSQRAFSIFENIPTEPHQFYSVGLHPWYITESNWELDVEKLEVLLKHQKVIALGECELDLLHGVDIKLQEKVFIVQLKLAEKYALPVVVHCVRAYNELMRVVKNEKIETQIIIHGFQSKMSILKPLLTAGFHISVGAAVLNSISINWTEMLNAIPIDSLFLETDDSNVKIKDIYERVAGLKNISVIKLLTQIEHNVPRVFNRI